MLRLTVQFVDLTEGSVRWEETIDSWVDDLLNVQDEVLSWIVERMRLEVSPEEQAGLKRDEALQALMHAESLNPDSPQMIRNFVVMLTKSGCQQEAISTWLERLPLEEAAKEAERALSLDPGSPFFRSGGTFAYLADLETAEVFLALDSDSTFSVLNRYGA